MSLSNPKKQSQPNPSKYFLEWKGEQGQLSFWNKEKKEETLIGIPFQGIICDVLYTVKGYNENLKQSVYANETRSINDTLSVRTKQGEYISGKWSDIKEKAKAFGGKFTFSVYVAVKAKEGYILANIQLNGSGIGNFIEVGKDQKKKGKAIEGALLTVDRDVLSKKGRVEFYPAKFAMTDAPEADIAQAIEVDKMLQEFLDGYFEKKEVTPPIDENFSQEPPAHLADAPPIENVYEGDVDLPF